MITVNGIPLQSILKRTLYSDIESTRNQEINERKQIARVPVGRVEQEYDTKPTTVRIYSKLEIAKMNLESDYKRLDEQMKNEIETGNPNRNKIIVGVLAKSGFKTIYELAEEVNKVAGDHIIDAKSLASIFTLLKRDKPLRKILQITNDKPLKYALLPSAAKLHLSELYQLTLKQGNFSLKDAFKKVPELEAEAMQSQTIVDSETTNEPDSKLSLNGGSVNGEVNVNVHVIFGPIKILFGIDKS